MFKVASTQELTVFLPQLFNDAGLPLQGAHHRGLDNARNIASLLPCCYGLK